MTAPTPLLTAALAMREMFETMRHAGFTEYQTCVIIGTWMAGTPRPEEGT